jgi:hypothetical protein
VSSSGPGTLLVHKSAATGVLTQDKGVCPAGFGQPQSSNFFKKIALTISIGNTY